MVRMKEKYQKTVAKELLKELSISNVYAVPKIEKVVINIGLGRMLQNSSKPSDLIKEIRDELALIAGARPVITKARKSIASFKLREGQPIGLKVTLRDALMYDFLDRLIHIALPRSRDFKGLDQKLVDKAGNLTLGIREHTIFPEVAEITRPISFEATIVTNTDNREQALELFKSLGFPMKDLPVKEDKK